MDMAALGDRRNEAGELRRLLPERAPHGEVPGAGEARLDRVGESRRAVEGHAQRVVELAKIGVVGDVAGVNRSVEAASLQLEGVKDDAKQIVGCGRDARPRMRYA